MPLEHCDGPPDLLVQHRQTFPGEVSTDQIIRIGQWLNAEHVYALQSSTGIVLAGGIVTHNCDFFHRKVVPSRLPQAVRDADLWMYNPVEYHTGHAG